MKCIIKQQKFTAGMVTTELFKAGKRQTKYMSIGNLLIMTGSGDEILHHR